MVPWVKAGHHFYFHYWQKFMSKGTPLTTQRLLLRPLTLADATFIVQLLNSPGWLQFIGDRNVHSEDDAKGYLLNGPLKSYADNGFGLWGVELKENRTPIGMCGLLKRDYLENPDIGFALLPDYTGKGYAYEAANATLDHAADALNIAAVSAIVQPGNAASVGLLHKLGMEQRGTITPPQGTAELLLYGTLL